MTTIMNLQIQMPREEDIEYSDDVYWTRWEMRQDRIEEEWLDDIPTSAWRVEWYRFNDDNDCYDDWFVGSDISDEETGFVWQS